MYPVSWFSFPSTVFTEGFSHQEREENKRKIQQLFVDSEADKSQRKDFRTVGRIVSLYRKRNE